jgi:Domain of unknown function (DUF4410)
MTRKWFFLVLGFVLCAIAASAQEKPVIVVQEFTAASNVAWPYEMKQMQTQTAAELRAKAGTLYDVATEVPTTPHGKVYTLQGEVTGWRPGNRAKRMMVGMAPAASRRTFIIG